MCVYVLCVCMYVCMYVCHTLKLRDTSCVHCLFLFSLLDLSSQYYAFILSPFQDHAHFQHPVVCAYNRDHLYNHQYNLSIALQCSIIWYTFRSKSVNPDIDNIVSHNVLFIFISRPGHSRHLICSSLMVSFIPHLYSNLCQSIPDSPMKHGV